MGTTKITEFSITKHMDNGNYTNVLYIFEGDVYWYRSSVSLEKLRKYLHDRKWKDEKPSGTYKKTTTHGLARFLATPAVIARVFHKVENGEDVNPTKKSIKTSKPKPVPESETLHHDVTDKPKCEETEEEREARLEAARLKRIEKERLEAEKEYYAEAQRKNQARALWSMEKLGDVTLQTIEVPTSGYGFHRQTVLYSHKSKYRV